ncbi:LacI family transcriptional regulator [Maritalea sp.]|uniref:LacI family transcriptional regulator n=1 Tax=Maritalea sp. TaxID=2003361 RepID=UPI003EF81B9E
MPGLNKPPRPTQRTIADRAGVSVGAVSRALSNDEKIAEHTRVLVHKIAKEVGYEPDRAAQRLRTGRTQVISLVLPPHEEIFGFGSSLIQGISDGLNGSAFHLVVMPDFGLENQDDAIRRTVKNRLADGVVFSRTEPTDHRVKYLLEEDFPFVCHGRTELATEHPYVDYDNFAFSSQAAQRLIERGASKLIIVLPPDNLTFRQHLLHGFMNAVRQAGVDFEILEGATLDSPSEKIRQAVQDRLEAPNPPDGVVCPGEVSGLAVLAAIHDAGLQPMKDVDVIVKQTSGLFNLVRPEIESLYEDLPEAGFRMAKLLLRRIAGESPNNLQYIQPVSSGSSPSRRPSIES